MPTSSLTAIVVAYNNRALTGRCLASLAAGWPRDWEVVLADNGSTDDTAEAAEAHRHEIHRLRVLRRDGNVVFSEVANAAARVASGDHLVFLNNDIEIGAAAVGTLVEALRRQPGAGVAGAKLVYPGYARVQHAGVRPMLWGLVSNYGAGASPDDARVNVAGDVFAVTGACVAVERALFEAVGGFDPGFRWGYEDIDLCLRARAAGRRVVYEPSAVAVHAESQTLGSAHYDRTRAANHQRYRARWDACLLPLELRYLAGLRSRGLHRLGVFGAGAAGRALAERLTDERFDVVTFVESQPRAASCDGRPIVALGEVAGARLDALMAATQFYFELEAVVAAAVPGTPVLFPVLD